MFYFPQSNNLTNAGLLKYIKQMHNCQKTGKQARNHVLHRTQNGVLSSVFPLLFPLDFTSGSSPREPPGKSARRHQWWTKACTLLHNHFFGHVLSFCTSTCSFKAIKCFYFVFFFPLGSVVLTPLDLDRKTTAMLKISDEMEL